MSHALHRGSADPGRGVKGWDPGTTGAQSLGQRSLRNELNLELVGQELPFELLVLTDVEGDDLAIW